MRIILLTLQLIITYFKLRENQNNGRQEYQCRFIITYFKLRENQNNGGTRRPTRKL